MERNEDIPLRGFGHGANGGEFNNRDSASDVEDTGDRNFRSDSTRKPLRKHHEDDDEDDGGFVDSHSNSSQETPKVILKSNRFTAFLHIVVFHAVPLAVTLFLIIFNSNERFYGPDGSQVPYLQFAAKAHEILMQMSIICILINYLQYLLTNRSAVPLGSLFFAHNAANAGYLFSPEFWATLTSSGFPTMMKLVFVVFVPSSILLASVVGPSSAIAMLPTFVNYTLPGYPDFALNTRTADLCPDELSEEAEYTPPSFWKDLGKLPTTDQESDAEISLQLVSDPDTGKQSFPFPQPYPIRTRAVTTRSCLWYKIARMLYVQYLPNSTIATTPHLASANALFVGADTIDDKLFTKARKYGHPNAVTIRMPQYYVSTVCQLNSISDEDDDRPFQFPKTYMAGCKEKDAFRCFNGRKVNTLETTDYKGISRREIWKQRADDKKGRIIWVEDRKVTSPVSESVLGAIIVQPEPCRNKNETLSLTTSACTIGVRWADTVIQLNQEWQDREDLTVSNLFHRRSTMSLPNWSDTSQSTRLSKTWAQSLDALTDVQNMTLANLLLRNTAVTSNICPENGTYGTAQFGEPASRPYTHEGLLSSLVVAGLSDTSWNVSTHKLFEPRGWIRNDRCPSEDSSSKPPGMTIPLSSRLEGYAWTVHGTSIKLALAVLGIYAAYVITYIVYVLALGRVSSAWWSVSGLVTLAMNSRRSSVLKDTGAGAGKADTFRKLVSAREVEGRDKVELVFDEDARKGGSDGTLVYRRVRPGKAYS